MAVGKVTLKEGNERKILIDLTKDTAVEDKVLKGYTFHKANGEIVNGTIETYSGTTEIKENGTLATSGKYLENDITINIAGSGSASFAPEYVRFNDYQGDTLSLDGLDTSKVTDMTIMFKGCSRLTSLDVSKFNTSNVTNMGGMFSRCHSLSNLDVSNFDTSKVTNMSYMFDNCPNLSSLDVSKFVTSNVTYMENMFAFCHNLSNLDVSKFDTSNVKNMAALFDGCSSLTSLDVSKFDTSNVISMGFMFSDCSSLLKINVSNFDTTNVTDMSLLFEGCTNLEQLDLSNFDTSNVTAMDQMFSGCQSLSNLDVSNFDTSNVTVMDQMFSGCQSLSNLDVSNFDTSNVTNMYEMFVNCSSLQTLKLPVKFNECDSDLGLIGLSNLTQILVPTPALAYYTDPNAGEHCYYFTDNDELKNKIVGYDTPTTTYTFVTNGGTPVEPITTNGFLQKQKSDPTTENYIFKGWYFDSEFTKKVKFPYLNLNENNTAITLYAKYGEPEPTSKRYAIDINAMSNPAVPVSYTITSDYKSTGLGDYPDWKSVWFKYTPSQDCVISLRAKWPLYYCVIDSNSEKAAEWHYRNEQANLTANTSYYIAVAKAGGELGQFTMGFNIQGV